MSKIEFILNTDYLGNSLNYTINNTLNDIHSIHELIENQDGSLLWQFSSHFFNNTPPPSKHCDLWHYEVVELFLSGANHHYLELELNPYNAYIAYSFSSPRKKQTEYINLSTQSSIDPETNTWYGKFYIPKFILPIGFSLKNKLGAYNACAIYNNYSYNNYSSKNKFKRTYLSLVPMKNCKKEPNFHQPLKFITL